MDYPGTETGGPGLSDLPLCPPLAGALGDSGGVLGYTLYGKGESPMDPVKTGTLIRTLRTRLGLTQRELAERLTVSDRTISKWERGVSLR